MDDDDDNPDSEVDEQEFPNKREGDTTASEARKGRDIQGIPWERLSITREKYHKIRTEQYKNYENVPQSGAMAVKECNFKHKDGEFYEFKRNSRSVKPTILHFQLRNLVCTTSKHDVYLMSGFSLLHWNAITSEKHEVLNCLNLVAPTEKHSGSLLEGFTQTQVSTFAVNDRLLVAGGLQGEIICKHLDRPGVSFCARTTFGENAITNSVEIYQSHSGSSHFMASNNDCEIREFEMESFQLLKQLPFSWPVNHTSVRPDGKLLVIVGDHPDGLLLDSITGKRISTIHGHLDFSFASAWHPDGITFATGNQDKTCRIWDIRNLSRSVDILRGNLGAIRSIRYSSDGRFLAMAEPADFVHVYDVKHGYDKEQEIDFFGEIPGISFSPDTETFFVGVWDRTYASLMEFGRRRKHIYLDSVFQ
ncbi:unnamed protein product [Rhodiola kirilowii]